MLPALNFYNVIEIIKILQNNKNNKTIKNKTEPNDKTIRYQRAYAQAISVGLKVGCKCHQTIVLLILLCLFFSFLVKNNRQKPPAKLNKHTSLAERQQGHGPLTCALGVCCKHQPTSILLFLLSFVFCLLLLAFHPRPLESS